jgi:steroid delta-isomerase-like uncharacterized protein
MTTKANKAVVRQYVDENLNRGNVEVIDELFAADAGFHFPGNPRAMDREGLKQTSLLFHSAFPDQHTSLGDLFADGDRVAARFAFRGTHQGDFQGIPPTGRAVTMDGMGIWQIADGKIAEHWVQFDALGLMQQIGAIPSFGQPGR